MDSLRPNFMQRIIGNVSGYIDYVQYRSKSRVTPILCGGGKVVIIVLICAKICSTAIVFACANCCDNLC